MLSLVLRDDGNNLVFTGYKLEVYIPEHYFKSNVATLLGSSVSTLGLAYTAVFDKNDKMVGKYELLNLPSMIKLLSADIEKREVEIIPESKGGTKQMYYVVKFYKDDKVMVNAVQQDSSFVETFTNYLLAGKLDGNIPYDKIVEVWLKNLELNNTRLNVPISVIGVIIGEIYRSKKNIDIKYSKIVGKDMKASMYDYITLNMRQICARNSTFSAVTFEDFDTMVTTSLNRKEYNKKQVESPVEKIIKM
jgi:hypothetical protein